ncbi:MAG: NTP transferase domain-containing protein [Candidatus Acidiferrales bacterium]
MIAVVILSAGESRRMGQPKALLPFPEFFASATGKNEDRPAARADFASAQPKTFLCHLIEVTRHPRAGILRVVVGAHAAEIRAQAKLDADELVVNEEWQRGQLSSLQAAIRSLPEGATAGMLVCLVDHPLISAQLVSTLVETFDRDKNKIVIPTYRGRRGHPVIFPSALYAELLGVREDAPENIGARAVVRAHAADVVEVPVNEEGVVINLNDPETFRRFSAQSQ